MVSHLIPLVQDEGQLYVRDPGRLVTLTAVDVKPAAILKEDTPEGTPSQSDGFGTQAVTMETENFMSSTQVEEGGGPPTFELEDEQEEELPEDSEPDLAPQMVTSQSKVHGTSASVGELGARRKEVRTTGAEKNTTANASMSSEIHFCDNCSFKGSENNNLNPLTFYTFYF